MSGKKLKTIENISFLDKGEDLKHEIRTELGLKRIVRYLEVIEDLGVEMVDVPTYVGNMGKREKIKFLIEGLMEVFDISNEDIKNFKEEMK